MSQAQRKSHKLLPKSMLFTSLMSLPLWASASNIVDVDTKSISDLVSVVTVTFDGAAVVPEAYKSNVDNRIVLNFSDSQSPLAGNQPVTGTGLVSSTTLASTEQNTHLFLDTIKASNYSSVVDGNKLILTINGMNTTDTMEMSSPILLSPQTPTPILETQTTTPATVIKTTSEPKQETMLVKINPLLVPPSKDGAGMISGQYSYDGLTAVNYTASEQGGNITIDLTNPAIPVDIQRQGDKLVVRMTGSTVPRNLLKRLNIGSSIITNIDAANRGQNGVITINTTGDFEYQAYQSGSQLNISLTPAQSVSQPTLEEKVYSGETLSMEFQDVEVRSVLDILAQFTEMNVIASDSVSGNITIRLINVPWDQALDIILKSKGLDKRTNGNVILVAPATELAEQERKELEAQQAVQTFAPLRTEYIRLSYATAQNIFKLISEGRGATSSNNPNHNNNLDNGSLLSPRGTVTVDERTNTLIVKDVSESIRNIRALIEKIDIPVKQVMIEARIVSATESFGREMGVKWGILSNGAATNRNLLVGSNLGTVNSLKNFTVESTTVGGKTINYPKYDVSISDNLNVDLGVGSAAGRIAFGLLSMSDLLLDLELSAMQADGRGEVISTPKVLTSDKQKASIVSGTQIPYQEASASGATSTSFKEAALSMEVTPNITPEGKIGLQLVINNDAPRQLATGEYAIDKNSINTNVVVDDGQTMVLGGVFRNTLSNAEDKVPFLGDLPYVGNLFKRKARSNNKEELLIFVTPKLINSGELIQ
ncbi:type IV pilus secretin PilQ [Moraxella lincolnii]|uniref:Pilus assembly protein PilQ n=1 Tax=Lwoffella lincolnii TaxID=90241 RepID=A0A1T0CC49_9GAMM|nr:type IV pilus secretin PilQ [Moraxella lincolnii]OOS19904.1 pilus assembly protein PilQ [Moraxella lincolnii]